MSTKQPSQLHLFLYHRLKALERNWGNILNTTTRKRTNLFILGEQKCGTTSLFKLLQYHPAVLATSIKECHYFNTDKKEGDPEYKNYHALFSSRVFKNYIYQLDASPDYLGDPATVEAIYTYNPEAKCIIILRDPIDRFVSAYDHYFGHVLKNLERTYQRYFQYTEKGKAEYRYLQENPRLTFAQFLEDEIRGHSPIEALARGKYFEHIARWKQRFGADKICLLLFENLISPTFRQNEIALLSAFLGLSLGKGFPHFNASQDQTLLQPDEHLQLKNYYKHEIALLYNLPGQSLVERMNSITKIY